MPAMSVGGLASGLDTNSIISQLTALEQAKVTREAKKKEAAQGTLDKFKELETRLGTLQGKANSLHLPNNFNVFAATSNYPEHVQIKGGEGATAGQYEVVVNQLATTQKVASNSFAAINTALNTETTITLSTSVAAQKKDSTKKTVDVKIEASDTLKDIVNKINAAEGTGVRASLMTLAGGENRLVLTAVDTGTNGFYISEATGGNLLTGVLGILDSSEQKAKSGNALVTTDGKAATDATTFDKLNTHLGKNDLTKDDVVGIYLPNGGWQTYEIAKYKLDGNGDPELDDNNNPIKVYKTIKEVLAEINNDLDIAGADFTAALNSSGEIVVQGKLDVDGNFNSANLGNVKIQIMSSTGGLNADDLKDALNGASVNTNDLLTKSELEASKTVRDVLISMGYSEDEIDGYTDNTDPGNPIIHPAFTQTQIEEILLLRKGGLDTKEKIEDPSLTQDDREKTIKTQTQKIIEQKQQAMFTVKKDMGKFTKANVFVKANVINEAQNAFYTLDGMAISSQSNEDDKTINGTTFILLKAEQPPKEVKVSLELDQNALVDKIAGFLEEFSALLKFIDENSKAITKEEENPATGRKTTTRQVGPFSGDSAISSLRDQIKRMMTSTIDEIAGTLDNGYKTQYSSAARIGITTNREGYLDIDREKLNKALSTDFEGVRRLFTANSFSDTNGFRVGNFNKNAKTGVYDVDATTGKVTLNGNDVEIAGVYGNIITTKDGLSFEVPSSGKAKVTFVRGIADQISNFVEHAKNTVDGFFKKTKETYQDRIDNIQKRVDQLQVRVDNYNSRLVSQFSALERSMSTLQSQTANMMSALGGMSYGR